MERQGTHYTSANSGAFEIGVYCSALAANIELHGRGHRRPYPGSPPSERRLPAPELGLELGDSSRISRCQVEQFRQISGQIEQPPGLIRPLAHDLPIPSTQGDVAPIFEVERTVRRSSSFGQGRERISAVQSDFAG